jgi:hypothetical protein
MRGVPKAKGTDSMSVPFVGRDLIEATPKHFIAEES